LTSAPVVPLSEIASEPSDDTTPTEDAILEVLRNADSPIKAVTIALRGKLNCNSYVRECLAGLVRRRLVERIDGCKYQIASTALEVQRREEAPAVPCSTSQPLAAHAAPNSGTCGAALLEMFEIVKTRMTAGQAHQWLQDHEIDYCHNSVVKNLSDLRKVRLLTNCTDGFGTGYGLPEWSRIAADPCPNDSH
jgi:hypothetical protein